MNCNSNIEMNIMQCSRELATDKCTHDDDAIVDCTNINFDRPLPPVPKTVRLMDNSNSVSSSGSGRLEIFMGGWGTICHFDFNDKAAKVACN